MWFSEVRHFKPAPSGVLGQIVLINGWCFPVNGSLYVFTRIFSCLCIDWFGLEMSETLDFLRQLYGPVMTVEQLAERLSRKPAGLRAVLGKANSGQEWIEVLRANKRTLGRRTYYPIEVVAKVLDGEIRETH